MKRRTVLTMEQALSMPYATLRFAQLGWRVIRIEPTPYGKGLPGDPNRYIGSIVADEDRRSYFIAPNVGKESISLNLKHEKGKELLKHLIKELDADIFCCNTLPARYESLGIDYKTLKSVKEDLIWVGISAMGPEYPSTPGYDPAIQAMGGYMEVTGEYEGTPYLMGVPVIDLKAGDEAYANVMLALAERAETGEGAEIHVSMLQAAVSWHLTTMPLLDFDCDFSEVTRCGNEHRKFIPVNAYPTSDGFIFIAIGNDIQWKKLVGLAEFKGLEKELRETNAGRIKDRVAIHKEMAEATKNLQRDALMKTLSENGIPNAPINTIPQVREMDAIKSKLLQTKTPDDKPIRLPPLAVDLKDSVQNLTFPPKYGENTLSVLLETGLTETEVTELGSDGVIAI